MRELVSWPADVDVAGAWNFAKHGADRRGERDKTPKGLDVGRRVQECSLASEDLS